MNYREILANAAIEPAFTASEAHASRTIVDAAILAAGEPSSQGIALVGRASDLARIASVDIERLRSVARPLAVWCLWLEREDDAYAVEDAFLDVEEADPKTVVCLTVGTFAAALCRSMVVEAGELFPNARIVCLTSVGNIGAKERARSEAMDVGRVAISFADVPDLPASAYEWGAAVTDRAGLIPPYVASRMLVERDAKSESR